MLDILNGKMNEERRHDERVETPIIGLLRNLTSNFGARAATIKNVFRGGFFAGNMAQGAIG